MRDEIEPIFESREDGVEYWGAWLANVGLMLPFAILSSWEPTNPLSWFCKGCVLIAFLVTWLFTIGWVLLFVGLVLSVIGESWNDMKSRQT